MRIKDNRSGIALVTVMCFLLLLSLAVALMLNTSGSQIRVVKGQNNLEKAQFVAEAGAERAASYITQGKAVPVSFSGTAGDGTYVVTIIAGPTVSSGTYSIGGAININPNNNPDNEFTVTMSDGTTVNRDLLVQDYPGTNGAAVFVHVKPKGNGNQNSLIVDGRAFLMENKNTYNINSSTMAVNIYNDNVNGSGKAVGKWWISIAATESTLAVCP